MGFQSQIADGILEALKGCVASCEAYDRILWQLGDPNIECSTLGIGLQSFPEAARMVNCVVNELRMNVVVAQCCWPNGDANGGPPEEAAVIEASRCVVDDVERILCCLNAMTIQIPGVVKPCAPTIMAPAYTRPSGGCLVAKIALSIQGVPCCD